jgi:hypothetical protein
MSYDQALQRLRDFQKRAGTVLTKPTKDPSVSFVGTHPRRFQKTSTPSVSSVSAHPGRFQKNGESTIESKTPLAGLPLLHDDWVFVNVRTTGRADKHAVLAEYARRWREASEIEPAPHKKDNQGRFAANSWLRELSWNQAPSDFSETPRTPTDKTDKSP